MSKISGTLASNGVSVRDASIRSARSFVVKRSRVSSLTPQRTVPLWSEQPAPIENAVPPVPRVKVSCLGSPSSWPVAVMRTVSDAAGGEVDVGPGVLEAGG